MNINEVFSGLDKLFAENRLPEVERYLTQALSDAEYEKDTDSMLAIYNELIGFHRTTGEHDKALYFCRQVMRLAHKMGIEDTPKNECVPNKMEGILGFTGTIHIPNSYMMEIVNSL